MKPRLAVLYILAAIILSPTLLAQQGNPQKDAEVRSRSVRQAYSEKKEDGLSVVVYLIEGSRETPIDPGARTFKKGDEIRVEFQSNFDGCVYFVNVDPAGEQAVAYPDLKFSDNQNFIRAGQRYRLPTKSILRFEGDQIGTETLKVIMARRPVAFLEDAITNHGGALGKTKANAASELGGFVVGKVTQILPDKGENAVLSRTIRLAPPRDKDKEGAVVTVQDKPLGPGEVAVFDILLRRN